MPKKIEKFETEILNRYKSQAAFAKKIGWDRRRINKIVLGKKEPDVGEVNEIAKGLEMDIGSVCGFFLP